MKRLSLLFVGVLTTITLHAQKDDVIHAVEIPVVYHGLTGKLIDYVEPKGTINEVTKTEKLGTHPKDWILNDKVNPNALPVGADPALQKHYPPPASTVKSMSQNWAAMNYTSVNPADPSVDVGPNHVVQMINGPSGSYIQVYSKTGTAIGSQVYFDNFMSMAGGAGDPIVLYDERADRWLLSEFSASGNNMHVAISQTSDPTGAYHKYTFNAPSFPDYPKYSIWEDAYIITTNESSSKIYALNRADMLIGTPTTAQSFSMTNFGTIGFQAATPVSLMGTTNPPSNTPPMVMRMRDDAWTGATNDALEIWDVNINWTTPASSSISMQPALVMSLPFDSHLCGYTSFSCIDQPSSSTNLDPLREVLMNRIMYRNFGSHESIVCCHVTDVTGSDDAGIRWYELRRTGGSSGSWTIYQESTYSPDINSRWMPSIGLAESGNIGLAYNVSSSTVFPSLRYTGRKECDPLNQMTEPETTIIAGTSPNGSNRYGDYNAMGVDPSDGETFFFTGMYNTATQWSTRIAAFNIDLCANTPEVEFDDVAITVNEPDATVAASACLNYAVVGLPISIGVAPSANADLTLTVSSSTATLGEDFSINVGSLTLNGSNLADTFEIWIYDDNIVEVLETITFGYTLNANGGDAIPGTANQLCDVDIIDNDLDPTSMVVTTTVLTQDFESGMAPFTTANPGAATAFALGTNATVPNGAFTVNPSNPTTFAWVDDDDCNCTMDTVDLIFPLVDLSSYTGATLTFDTYFEDNTYSGVNEDADLIVTVGGGPETVIGPLVASGVDGPWVTQNFDVSAYAGNSNVQFIIRYSDGGGWLYGLTVDDVLLQATAPIGIQTAVNTTAGMEADFGPNATVHFYDPATDNIMLTLENTSSFDYGCVTVEVDRDGSTPSAVQFNTTNTADYLHSKTYTVVPTNTNPTGTYNMTVYYEEAEVAAWETATGNSRANAEIVKVDGPNQISDVTPATYASYTISSTPTTVGAFYSDVTFTGSFSTGFSGFGVGIYNALTGTAPTASFSASTTTICEGATVSFTDLSTDGPTSWSWDFGDSGTSTAQNPSHTYTTAGNYTVTMTATNTYGSDVATVASYITVLPAYTSSQNVSLCPGSSVTVGTSTYTSAGTYTDVLVAGNGCDSTVTTNVTMLPTFTSSQNVSFCPGGSVTVGTSTYTSAGTYTDVLTATNGCDSTVTTNVTVLAPTSMTQNVQICSGSSYSIGTSTYTTNGTYTDVLVNAAGCDSTVTTNLTVVSTITNTLNYSLCPGNSVTVGSSTYSSAGTYTDVLPSTAGCDSVITTNITMLAAPTTSQTFNLCPGQSVTVGSSTYNSAGTYTDVLMASNGCDSTVTTTVNMLSTSTSSQNVEICQGASYTIGSSTYTSTGTYTDVLTGSNGCDSTVTTNLLVNPLPTVSVTPATIDPLCSYEPSVQLTGSPAGGSFSGTGVSGSSFDPATAGAGTHIITYSYTDGNGCTGTINLSVVVKDCAGVPEEALEGVSLHPNPNDGTFVITGLEIGTHYKIFDDRGRLVMESDVSSDKEEVTLPVVNNGIYYLRAKQGDTEGGIKFLIAR